MKKLSLLLGIVLAAFVVNAQDTTKVKVDHESNNITINIDLDEILNSVEDGIVKMQDVITEKQAEVDVWNKQIYAYTEEPDGEDVYEKQIDSLDELIHVNEEIIEDLNEAIVELSEEMDELKIELQEELSDIHVNIGDFDDDDDDNDCKGKKHKKFKGHWSGMTFGVNTFVDNTYSLNLPGESDYMTSLINKSWEYSINPLQFSIPFFNRYVGAVTGLGFSFNNYELIQNVNLGVDVNGLLTNTLSDVVYDKNRFKTFNMNVPLLIEFQIPVNKKDRRIFIGAGVIGTMNLGAKMKTVYKDGNTVVKYKDKSSNWPVTQFSYQGTARVGYNDWYLFANYNFLPLFDQNKGPEVYPVSAGVGFRF
ncbi:MAG: hypothetical protein JXL97_11005 [Bacteroidales bacterium]|nr:hypothetical protein [Bacteroidales bacterium]